ncbi:MAG: hypothetical protein COT24_05005 [Candidatus Kerfeldbacteria bacterium CG08_land_8_20_14_0_20_40_16]|uniref:Uncharacterized protein n=1 Tax=Candidatus Kerfeldbacteria bacterium CG08_land_8_20_14_0_20_40_16 TaxID=2014244 RepID=A0A2H0YUI5_9BACT|nr:MAG: hypothetical protein COT24_05005 [Candidatus Kerfeldbacteria bacterium CG08_land_8_20_14_0_20_40_16]
MTFPLYLILILYLLAIIFYLILSVVLLYHIFRFGYWDSSTKLMIFLYFAGSLIILVSAGIYIAGIDWSENVSILNNTEFNINFF